MDLSVPTAAGALSTTIFAAATMPMLWKARRSKELASYSLGNIGLANVGNVVHSVYVFSLPPGPVWALHTFYLLSSLVMLLWYLRYERPGRRRTNQRATVPELHSSPDAGRLRPHLASCPRRDQVRGGRHGDHGAHHWAHPRTHHRAPRPDSEPARAGRRSSA